MSGQPNGLYSNGSSSNLPAPTQILRSNATEEDIRPCTCLVNYFTYYCGCPSPRADYTISACRWHTDMTVGDRLSETFLQHRQQLISRGHRTWQAQSSGRTHVLGYNCPLHGGPAHGSADEHVAIMEQHRREGEESSRWVQGDESRHEHRGLDIVRMDWQSAFIAAQRDIEGVPGGSYEDDGTGSASDTLSELSEDARARWARQGYEVRTGEADGREGNGNNESSEESEEL